MTTTTPAFTLADLTLPHVHVPLSLDPISAHGIEKLLRGLKERYTVVMVTHDIDQARRLADHVVFMWLGELIEHRHADQFFVQPQQAFTRSYLNREIG